MGSLDELLRHHHLFSALDEGQLAAVAAASRLQHLSDGDLLFSQGQAADRFYLVRHGQVKLFRLAPDGQEKVIEVVSPGQSFAEAVMFMQGERYPVAAQALGSAEVLAVESRAFLGVLRSSSESCLRLLAGLSVRLHERLKEIETVTLQNATLRLANYLLNLGEQQGEQITLPAAKHIIASQLAIQPETLSRILGNLASNGIIRVKGLAITILDRTRLRSIS